MPFAQLEVGRICKSKDPIVKTANADDGRLCRVFGLVSEARWRHPSVPEYKVQLVALPISAFKWANELEPVY